MFKNFLAIAVMAGMATMPVNAAEEAHTVNVNNIHSEVAVITETKSGVNTLLTLSNNNMWEYEKDGYKVGDLVSVTFDTKGTKSLEDDEIIIDPFICGTVEGEAENGGLIEYIETCEDDRLEWFTFDHTFFLAGEDF